MSKKGKRITCLVPGMFLPNKDVFVDLGFTFNRVFPHPKLSLVTLPQGWISVGNEDDDTCCLLLDEKNCKRGYYLCDQSVPNNFTTLVTRFYISVETDPNDSTKEYLYLFVRDRTNRKVLFSERSDPTEKNEMINNAKDFLNIQYPDWENPSKYWDLNEKDIQYWCQ